MSAVADTARIHVASSAAIVGANIPPRLANEANIGDRNTQIDPATKPVNKKKARHSKCPYPEQRSKNMINSPQTASLVYSENARDAADVLGTRVRPVMPCITSSRTQ